MESTLYLVPFSRNCDDCGQRFTERPEYRFYPSAEEQLAKHRVLRHPEPTIADIAKKLDRIIALLEKQ